MDHFRPDELLFEIPVYRVSLDKFRAEFRNLVEESIANKPPWDEQTPDEVRESVEMWARRVHGRPYWYNDMMGVIRLYQDDGSIKAEYWGQPQRIFRKNFRHYMYEHRGRMFEYHIGPVPLSSSEIYEIMLDRLSRLTRHDGPLPRRHIDLYAFRRVGPRIDWVEVLGWKPPVAREES